MRWQSGCCVCARGGVRGSAKRNGSEASRREVRLQKIVLLRGEVRLQTLRWSGIHRPHGEVRKRKPRERIKRDQEVARANEAQGIWTRASWNRSVIFNRLRWE
jgi:head-tail adaptor